MYRAKETTPGSTTKYEPKEGETDITKLHNDMGKVTSLCWTMHHDRKIDLLFFLQVGRHEKMYVASHESYYIHLFSYLLIRSAALRCLISHLARSC